jgi:rhodanese-related sulfurtransferase
MLIDEGFTGAKALLGGLAAWQRAGLPVESSTP